MKKKKVVSAVYIGIILVIMYIPIILTVIYSFNVSRITSVWSGVTLDWYKTLFNDDDMWEALRNSIVLGVSCSLFAVIIGTSGALGMRGRASKSSKLMAYISTLPIMIPEIILGMVFLALFSLMGLPFGMVTLIIAHTSFCIPYVFMLVRSRLAGMDKSIEDAARDLGASPVRAFFDVTLPAILPAIISGALLSFAMSFDDVVISIFVTGASTNTLAVKIYTRVKQGVTPEINALASILLVATIAIVVAFEIIQGKMNNTAKKKEKEKYEKA